MGYFYYLPKSNPQRKVLVLVKTQGNNFLPEKTILKCPYNPDFDMSEEITCRIAKPVH